MKKAKEKPSIVKFAHVDDSDKLKVLAYTDSSHLNIEEKLKSVSGRMVFLSSENEENVSPIRWKAKTIPQVVKSAKSAETRAADMCSDDAVFLSRVIKEMYTGKKGYNQLELTLATDSKSLVESLGSTKQVEQKLMRPVVQYLKDLITRKWITEIRWVPSDDCHADVLTKKGAKWSDKILKIFRTGKNC